MGESGVRRIVICLAGLQAYQLGILQGVRRAARSRPEWRLRVESSWAIQPEHVAQATVDGVIGEFYDPLTSAALVRRALPTVSLFGTLANPSATAAVIGCDDSAIGALAADDLAGQGYTSFAVIGTDHDFSRLRAGGFVARLRQKHGVEEVPMRLFNARVIRNHPLDISTLEHASLRWLAALPNRTAVFATADRVARAVAQACASVGRDIPHEIGLLGVDDDPGYCESAAPFISSIRLPWEELGLRACAMLDALLSHRATERDARVLPIGITARDSTRRTGSDAVVADAVAFIRENLHRPIGPQDVVEHLGVAMRTLQRRFAEALGHGLREELQIQRIAEVKRLLKRTDLDVSKIVERVGLSSAAWFSKVFRRHTGQTLAEFRASERD